MIILDGKQTAATLSIQLKDKVEKGIVEYGRAPKLAVILIGNNPASISYIKGKKKACEKVGIIYNLYHLEENVGQSEVFNLIEKLNGDDSVDGILLQLPISKHLDENILIDAIDYEKDVDGFHVKNLGYMYQKKKAIHPATPEGIMQLLKYYNIKLEGLNAVVIGRSNNVGFPTARLLMDQNATVTICHSKTKDIASHTREADLIVVAAGKPKLFTKDMIKPGAIVVDVGINRVDGKLIGDVDFDGIKESTSYITPVPGGVGPMTIYALLENTYTLYLKHQK